MYKFSRTVLSFSYTLYRISHLISTPISSGQLTIDKTFKCLIYITSPNNVLSPMFFKPVTPLSCRYRIFSIDLGILVRSLSTILQFYKINS